MLKKIKHSKSKKKKKIGKHYILNALNCKLLRICQTLAYFQ